MPRRWLPLLLCCTAAFALPFSAPDEVDNEESRRVLGSSVVTSVSVIMDLGNGTKKYFADAAGRPVPKPTAAAMVGSPAGLLNPDRYEFYTFDEAGDLVKRLMTLDEIQSIIANGESELGELGRPNYYHQNIPPDSMEPDSAASSTVTDKVVEEAEATDMGELSSSVPGVHDVVVSVQNVLKSELEASKNKISSPKPVPPSPQSPTGPLVSSTDSSSSWGMILPGIMTNASNASNTDQTTYSTTHPTSATSVMKPSTTEKLSSASSPQVSSISTHGITTTPLKHSISTTEISAKEPLNSIESIFGEQSESSALNNLTKVTSSSLLTSPTTPSLRPSSSTDLSSSSSLISEFLSSAILSTMSSNSTSAASSELPSSTLFSTQTSPNTQLSSKTPQSTSSTTPNILPFASSSQKLSLPSSSSSLPELSSTSMKPLSVPTMSSLSTSIPISITSKRPLPMKPLDSSSSSSSSSSLSATSYSKPQYPLSSNTTAKPPVKVTIQSAENGEVINLKYTSVKPSNNNILYKTSHGTTLRPVSPTRIYSSTQKTSTIVSNDVVSVSEPSSSATSVSRPPVSSVPSINSFSKIPVTDNKYTAYDSVNISKTVPLQTSPVTEITTNSPLTSALSSTNYKNITASHFSTREPIDPTMVMISSSELYNHDDTAAAQQFFNLFSPSNLIKVNTTSTLSSLNKHTRPTSTEQIKSSSTATALPYKPTTTTVTTTTERNKTMQSSSIFTTPATSTEIHFTKIQTLPQKPSVKPNLSTTTQSKNPTKPLRTTPSPSYFMKTTSKPYRTSTYATRTTLSSTKPSSLTASTKNPTTDEIINLSTIELLKTTAKNKPTTSPVLSITTSTTKYNEVENSLINEASGFVPTKVELPVGTALLPVTGNSDLDMTPELAESVLGVLSQVADVGGAATTIDYGENPLFILDSSSITTTQQPNVENVGMRNTASTSSSNRFTVHTSTQGEDKFKTTQRSSIIPSLQTTENLMGSDPTTLQNEETGKDLVTTEYVTDVTESSTSKKVSDLIEKESVNEKSTSRPVDNIGKIHEESTTEILEEDLITTTTISSLADNKKEDEYSTDSSTVKLTNEEISANVQMKDNVQDQQKIENELKVKMNDEILKTADSKESLKINPQFLENKPVLQESAQSIEKEADKEIFKDITTTEIAETTTHKTNIQEEETKNSETDNASPVGASESTTEEQNSNTRINYVESVTKLASSNNMNLNINLEENISATESSTLTEVEVTTVLNSNKELIPEKTTSKINTPTSSETTDSSTQSGKDNVESSTTLTKYKKDDLQLVEEAIQDDSTLKPTTLSKINIVRNTSNGNDEIADDLGNISTVNEESTTSLYIDTTELFKTIDETTQSESDVTDSVTIKEDAQNYDGLITAIVSDSNLTIKEEPISNKMDDILELKIDTNENSELKKKPNENIDILQPVAITSEETTETLSKYEVEVTTIINFEAYNNKSDYETVSTIKTIHRETEKSEVTTIHPVQINETKIDANLQNNITKSSQGVETIMNTENTGERSTEPSEELIKLLEPDIKKTTIGSTSWTKVPTISQPERPENKIIDDFPVSSTIRPINKISAIAEESTMPDTLKIGNLKEDKENDKNKIKPDLQRPQPFTTVDLEPVPQENLGLEATSLNLEDDVRRFAELCNELAFRLWSTVTAKGLTTSRSLIMSPFAVTSLLAMVFLGARGPTSGQMNDILRLDDMVTFNPHQVFRNVTESVAMSKAHGIATAAFVRELYSDRAKGKLLEFYKERAQQFYDGHVEEVNFNMIGDLVRRRTNLLIKRETRGKVPEYLRGSNIMLRPPLAVFSANIFQTDCSQASTYGRDGEMYFTVMPALRQRRLVPVPAVVWFNGFLAGYEPILDATAVSIGNDDSIVSLIMVLPGQQGQQAPGDGLQRLEQRLIETSYRRGAWSRLLRSLAPRPGLELQIPRFSHRSLLNVTAPLQRMGLKDLFSSEHADLRGINGLANDLHLSDIVQVNTFSTCAEESIGSRHHVEVYPTSPQRSGREELDEDPKKEPTYFDDLDDLGISSLPLALRPRQARLPDAPRLRFDRPFLYFVRHNPTGLILHMGRFNPRLLH